MNQRKYDRMQKRKAVRDAEKQQQREEKLKHLENKDKNPNGKPYKKIRKLHDGGIAFGKNYKIGRGGLIGFAVVGSILLFLFAGLNGAYDEFLPPTQNMDEFYLPFEQDEMFIPVIDGDPLKDYSGNIIQFKSQVMLDKFLSRINANIILNFFLNQ